MSTSPLRLHGQHVALRDFTDADDDAAHALVGDPAVTDHLSFAVKSKPQTAEMISGIVTRAGQVPRTEYYLAIELDHEVIGFGRLGLSGVQAAKLGYAIRADQWGRGYATDAVRALVSFAFRDLGLHRVSAAIGPENGASIGVVKRAGFTYEGRLRDHVHTNGAWRDSQLYSVLAHEWPADPA